MHQTPQYTRHPKPAHETNTATSYLFWIACIFQLNGLHRLYNGKIGSGLLWLFTLGLFGFGQVIDLFLIPGMVEEHNFKVRGKFGFSPEGVPLGTSVTNASIYQQPISNSSQHLGEIKTKTMSQDQLMIELAKVAQRRDGKISVTQAVIETGVPFDQVEATLKLMLRKGYVVVDNHPENGMVVYHFIELA